MHTHTHLYTWVTLNAPDLKYLISVYDKFRLLEQFIIFLFQCKIIYDLRAATYLKHMQLVLRL